MVFLVLLSSEVSNVDDSTPFIGIESPAFGGNGSRRLKFGRGDTSLFEK
jgi:hypothetical protein